MSEAMSDMMSTLRDHAPSVPAAKEAAKDARDAVLSHLPSKAPDLDAVKGKKSVVVITLGLLAAAAAVVGYVLRQRS